MKDPFSLKGKTILVTGASSGIGRSIAIECSNMGGILIITGRNEERLNQTFSLLSGSGHKQIIADLNNYSDIEFIVNQLPKLDGVVSNAGVVNPILVKISEKEDVEQVLNINTKAPIFLTQLLLKEKCLNKGASLVYISSISGNNCAYLGGSLYGASKAAISGFTKALALELSTRKIRVNTINPGMIETSLFDNSSLSEDLLNEDRKKYPLGRYGKPEDVAYSVIYLLSDASEWITGTNLLIDGGYTLQ